MANFFSGYLAQGTGSSSTGFVENTAAGYARVAVTQSPLQNGACALSVTTISAVTTPVTVTQRAVYDASTGGNLIMWWNLVNSVSLAANSFETIKAGALSHTFPDLFSGVGNGAEVVEYLRGRKIGNTSDGNPIFAGHFITVTGGVVAAASSV